MSCKVPKSEWAIRYPRTSDDAYIVLRLTGMGSVWCVRRQWQPLCVVHQTLRVRRAHNQINVRAKKG